MRGPGTAHAARSLAWTASGRAIVDGVTFAVPPGRFTALIGPNGSGKSTVLRLLAGLRRPSSGHALLDGSDVTALKRRDVARRLAFVAQETVSDLDTTVSEVVMLGRAPHRGRSATTEEDIRAVGQAMAAMGVTALADRSWASLSGGERQRVNIARALAQQTPALLLDEPTNHLDISHRLDLMEMLSRTAATVVAALHELDLAARYCDHLVLLHAGRVVAAGPPITVLTPRLLEQVYQVRATVNQSPDGRPDVYLAPLPRTPSSCASNDTSRS
ncbi:ABC transporter ATP-binding protein [Streptomyces hygroscopicus subsp. sporocinereus]|uniref:ABC transporter ATP-binding protein n=1 Tax=Streptomyces hygroscopicus TaxID=1912 RepID=A0ABQ3TU96_STRHY|nr:ABC transporter ATP-binding protein [Streptomyces hygroscopicus]GHJ26921.1 ABC transporter ATP-binding protein [Streptomyces hygroscopicus]